MAKVYAPYKGYCGISAGVTFKEGVGETSDPHLLEWFKAHGYTVEVVPVKAELPKVKSPAPVSADEEPEPGVKVAPKRSGKKTQGASGKKKEE